jgi:CheY-like chemotaxis protein
MGSTRVSDKPNVLVLDDAAVVRRVVSERLERSGLETRCVARNEEALGALLRAAKGAWALDALVQDHERVAGGDGTRMLKVMRRMYADRVIPMTGLRIRAIPVIVLSGEPESCGPTLRDVDSTVMVIPKHSSAEGLSRALYEQWSDLRDRLIGAAAASGARVVRSRHGWVVDTGAVLDNPLFLGRPEQLEATLGRLDRGLALLTSVIPDIAVAAR